MYVKQQYDYCLTNVIFGSNYIIEDLRCCAVYCRRKRNRYRQLRDKITAIGQPLDT